jgi:hypothetical protein
MVTKGSSPASDIGLGAGKPAQELARFRHFGGCRKGREKVDCRGTMMVPKSGAKNLDGEERKTTWSKV